MQRIHEKINVILSVPIYPCVFKRKMHVRKRGLVYPVPFISFATAAIFCLMLLIRRSTVRSG